MLDKLPKIWYNKDVPRENNKNKKLKEVMIMTKKMTKKEMFTAMLAKYNFTEAEVEFINHELELLAKKNSAERGLTKTQKANLDLAEAVYDFLCDTEKAYTVSELCKACPELAKIEATTSKATAILRMLKDEGKVVNYTDKRKSYYKVAD